MRRQVQALFSPDQVLDDGRERAAVVERGARGREGFQRMSAEPHDRDGPRVAVAQPPGTQRRDEPCPDQRRLPAARGAEYGEEAAVLEALEQPLDVAVASEEERCMLSLEYAQAAIGTT